MHETTPLVGAFPAAQYNSTEIADSLPFLPAHVPSIAIDTLIVDETAATAAHASKIALLAAVAMVVPPVVFLLALRSSWVDIPPFLPVRLGFLLLFSKEGARFALLINPWICLVLSVLGLRFYSVSFESLIPTRINSQPTRPVTRLPISPSLMSALRKSAFNSESAPPISQKDVETIVFWAEHPASLRVRNDWQGLALVSSLLWAQVMIMVLLAGGLMLDPHSADVFSWVVNLLLLLGTPALYFSAMFYIDRDLKHRPIEYRGIGEGGLIAGIDIRKVVLVPGVGSGWMSVQIVERYLGETMGIVAGDVLMFFALV
ncbi:hypothetical protein HDU81_004049 [Chytriomyces hyalinus]|nr:hypothetical protein HDU81_004049 [Chytriomyces hyalinus]